MPPVALVGITKVWPEEVKAGPPAVRVVAPATRLVGLPINVIPSKVYAESADVTIPVAVPIYVAVAAFS